MSAGASAWNRSAHRELRRVAGSMTGRNPNSSVMRDVVYSEPDSWPPSGCWTVPGAAHLDLSRYAQPGHEYGSLYTTSRITELFGFRPVIDPATLREVSSL